MNKILIVAAAMVFVYGCSENKAAEHKTAATPAVPHYELVRAEQQPVPQLVKLPAQLAAYQEVTIFPKVNGYVKSVLVDIGSPVKAGQLLMELEAPELAQAMMQAKERYARTVSDYTISHENYERLVQASRTPGAISPMDLATARARTEADSALSNSEKANWQMQQTMMGYLRVTAPFSGVITQRNVHPGALVSAEARDSKPMLELKEVDHLRLQVDIPESIASGLRDKDSISFYLSAFPGKRQVGLISRRSGNISMQYRSERMEIDVYNKSGQLSPGMYADVLLDSKGNPNALAVPKSAVVTSTERKYVIVVRDGMTVRVDVSTGNESGSRVEVLGNIQPGEPVVANANDEIKEGVGVH
ncbi:MAG TPA: efflux RND transporter periplasmic adaptor subunit [Puia sp.]